MFPRSLFTTGSRRFLWFNAVVVARSFAASQTTSLASLEVDRERISETPVHECDMLIVWRKVGSLTEMGVYVNFRGQMIPRIFQDLAARKRTLPALEE